MPQPKPAPAKDEGSKTSFWMTAPGILTGMAAIITALGGLLAVLHSAGLLGSGRGPASVTPAPPPAVSAPAPAGGQTPSQPGSPSAAGPDQAQCLSAYFKGLPKQKLVTLESGTNDFRISGIAPSGASTIGLTLNEDARPIGAMRLSFFANGEIFKIASIVDAACREIEEYRNASRGGDRHVLQNWDTVELRLGGRIYSIRVGYSSGEIGIDFVKISPP